MRHFAVTAFLICALTVPSPLLPGTRPKPPTSPPAWFWGCWVVTKALPITAIVGIGPKKEKAIIGTRIVFTPTRARSGKAVVESPACRVTELSAGEFWNLGRYPLSQIGILAPRVTQVSLDLPGNMSDLDFPGNYVYLRKKDIVIDVENVAFLAVKAKAGDPACACSSREAK